MNAEELNFNEIDNIIRNAAEKLPTGDSQMGWEKLSGQLEQAGSAKKDSKKKFFRGFSLNTWLLIGVISVVGIGGYELLAESVFSTVENNYKSVDSITEKGSLLVPKEEMRGDLILPKEKHNENTRATEVSLIEKSLKTATPAKDDETILKRAAEDSTNRESPYIFW